MALKKDILTRCGITGNYVKITNYTDNTIYTSVWLDKKARDSNFDHLPYGKTYTFPESVLSESNIKEAGKSPLVLLYDYLKTLNEFSEAEDI